MPSKVYNNIEGHKLIDNGNTVEDVTSVTLPDIKHTTSTFDASGMVAAVDVPNPTHIEAMEFKVSHNNGVNCHLLANPIKHTIELRMVRQRYDVPSAEIQHESVKFRVTCMHKDTSKGNIETNNPYGSTDTFSVLRYEEIVNGETVILIDAMAGIIKYNGVDYASAIDNLLM